MKQIIRAALCLAVLGGPPLSAAAQPAPPARAQAVPAPAVRDQLATELGRILFESMNMIALLRTQMATAMRADAGSASGFKAEWSPLLEQAVIEEMQSDLPRMHALFGRAMTRDMTEAEIRAGLAVLGSRAGRAAMGAASRGGTMPTFSAAEAAELGRVIESPAGKGFERKLDAVDGEAAGQAIVAELTPGIMRRFAAKIEAAKAPR
jgi:hypothetical protein